MKYWDIENIPDFCIIFTYEIESIVSKIIWFFSKKDNEIEIKRLRKASHTMVYIGNGIITEAISSGVVVRKIPKFKKKKFNISVFTIIGKPDKEKMKDYIFEHSGSTKYDFAKLIILFFQKIFGFSVKDLSKKVICSEWAIDIYRQGGIDLMEGFDACNISPIVLMQSEKLELWSN